jgi:hypothetical protein
MIVLNLLTINSISWKVGHILFIKNNGGHMTTRSIYMYHFLEKMESENYYHPLHDNKGTLY